MSACIYHQGVVAAALCPGCDFDVCRTCLDGGSEGVCSTCAEERRSRKQQSAVQREYTVEEQVPRCSYCRTISDAALPLDAMGYCPACANLPRCGLHRDQVVGGRCKSCRKEACRQCLGFTGVCKSCAAKTKARLATGPLPGPGSGKIAEEKPSPVRSKTDPALTRGQAAMQARIEKKLDRSPQRRKQVIASGAVGAIAIVVVIGCLWSRANAPEVQQKHLMAQMMIVHQGVMHFYTANKRLPTKAGEVYSAALEANPSQARGIHVARRSHNSMTGEPGAVLFETSGEVFIVTAATDDGKILTDSHGNLLFLDQSYDSAKAP